MKYDWIEIYQEFANRLLDYKNNRAELIRILQEIYFELNLKYPLIDEEEIGKDVCPFSVMGLFWIVNTFLYNFYKDTFKF